MVSIPFEMVTGQIFAVDPFTYERTLLYEGLVAVDAAQRGVGRPPGRWAASCHPGASGDALFQAEKCDLRLADGRWGEMFAVHWDGARVEFQGDVPLQTDHC
jgi:hypothetical protein